MSDEDDVIYLYKYLRFSDGSKKILSDSTIKFTCPSEFNDPFDCLPYYSTSSIKDFTRARPDLFKELGKRRGLSPANRLKERGKITAELQSRIDDGPFVKEQVNSIGVVSLSRSALNILMWSHYADYHRGFVLEFRIPTKGLLRDIQILREHLAPLTVNYKTERPHINLGTEPHDSLLQKALLTKSVDWEYEEEERVIDNDRGPGIYHYNRDEVLFSVIVGMRMDEDNYRELELLVRGLVENSMPDLKLYKANVKDGEYALEVKDHPRLGVSS